MSKFFTFLLKILFLGLLVNTCLILIEYASSMYTNSAITQWNKLNQCCSIVCEQERSQWLYKVIDYTEISKKTPRLDPSYRDTHIRLGSDLSFNLTQCPPGSLMPAKKNFFPKHLNCPTLYLVGARKAGTTSLYQYISKHPEFRGTKLDAGPKAGETFYFSRFYDKRGWEQYLSLFPSGGVMTGDASVGNLVHHLAPRRLYESCGKQAKVIMLFRDPINRFESNFLMRSRRQTNRITPETGITAVVKLQLDQFFSQSLERTVNVVNMPQEWSKLVNLFLPAANMIYEGLYYVHLLNWLCNFPAENILIINSEEFYHNSIQILDIVFQFLELKRLDYETYKWVTKSIYNKGKYDVPYYQKLSTEDKVRLLGIYKPFNKALLKLLQWNSIQWQH